ncbi:MAG TPA: sigma-70 family RNA polymerase sigma factor [Fimbriimonadaceae bacterium]|nr:sigma-70 family RNA polymerase sigma factor [Fimbriimonadaceae bacterium]
MLFTLLKDKPITAKDREALFEQLLRNSYRQAYSLAVRLSGNASEAEDLVQETFLRAYRFFHRYDESLPFTSWLYRIMTNAHIDVVRRKGRLKTFSLESRTNEGQASWDVPDETAAADRALLHETMDEHIQQGLVSMTPEFRTAVLLSDVEGLAYEEIAEVMQTSIGTVRSRIHRGRKQLRKFLQKRCPQTYGGLTHEL